MQHTVKIWDKPHTVTTHRQSKSVWIASGSYMGQDLQTKDATEGAALKRWVEAARYKGN